MYMQITPDFSFLTEKSVPILIRLQLFYSSLIFIGLIAIFLVSSQAVKRKE